MYIDLSLSLPFDHPVFELAASMGDQSPASMGHVGTHLDTYLQKPIPLEWVHRRGILVDVRRYGDHVPTSAIDGLDIQAGDFVIFYTGFIDKHDYGSKEYFKNHPQLDWELIKKLLTFDISFIGIDAAGIRHGAKLGDDHHKADVFCEESHTYVIENLINLSDLAKIGQPFDLRVAWISHRGASGIPCKVVAEIKDAHAA